MLPVVRISRKMKRYTKVTTRPNGAKENRISAMILLQILKSVTSFFLCKIRKDYLLIVQ